MKVLGKPIEAVADEFAEANLLHVGDVRYHCGTYADVDVSVRTGAEGAQGSGGRGGKKGTRTVHVSLAANPSHLEMVGPVVVGKTKAKQIYADDAMDRGNERNQEMQVRGERETETGRDIRERKGQQECTASLSFVVTRQDVRMQVGRKEANTPIILYTI